MSKRLWNYFNGEPFLVNPHLAVFSPNPKKGKSKMAARKRRTTRRVRRTSRRRSRRNPYPVAGIALNPRRRRRAKSTHRRRTRRSVVRLNPRRRYRRNPVSRRGINILGISLPPLQSVIFAGVGFIAPPVVEGFLSQWLPAEIQTSTIGKYAIKIGSVLALSFGVKQLLGNEQAKMVAIGGGAYILHSAINDFAPGILPAGIGAYVQPNSLGAYVNGNQSTFSTLGEIPGGIWPGASNRNRIPARFDRF